MEAGRALDLNGSGTLQSVDIAERFGHAAGIIASDDVNWSYAFLDYCSARKLSPVVLSDVNKCFGLVRRGFQPALGAGTGNS